MTIFVFTQDNINTEETIVTDNDMLELRMLAIKRISQLSISASIIDSKYDELCYKPDGSYCLVWDLLAVSIYKIVHSAGWFYNASKYELICKIAVKQDEPIAQTIEPPSQINDLENDHQKDDTIESSKDDAKQLEATNDEHLEAINDERVLQLDITQLEEQVIIDEDVILKAELNKLEDERLRQEELKLKRQWFEEFHKKYDDVIQSLQGRIDVLEKKTEDLSPKKIDFDSLFDIIDASPQMSTKKCIDTYKQFCDEVEEITLPYFNYKKTKDIESPIHENSTESPKHEIVIMSDKLKDNAAESYDNIVEDVKHFDKSKLRHVEGQSKY